MRILVTGAKGFVGRNLCAQLNNIRDGKARNYGFASTLLDTLKKHGNTCPVMLSSSQQASLTGRFGNSEYGRSKKAGEDLFLKYGEDTGAKVLVYRFPNLFGKWCRPNYNSAVATFCNAVANDLPYTVNDPSVELELLYIDDLVDEMIACLKGEEHRCEFDGLGVFPIKDGRYCYVPTTHKATLGEIVDLLHKFEDQRKTLIVPEIPAGSFDKKLYSTFLSYLPKERTYVTGSPMAEVLHNNLAEIEASDIHRRLGLEKGKYILLSAHREENIDTEKNFLSLFNAINKMAEKYDMPILYSCHPRSRKRLEASGFQLDKRVIQHEPLGFHDYNCLQMNAFAVVSDSGTLPEESSFFTSVGHPFPAVCIRTSTERPEALDKGCFVLSGIDTLGLLQSVDIAVELIKDGHHGIPVPDYVDENVSTKVVRIIQSYTGVVNKMVWRKY